MKNRDFVIGLVLAFACEGAATVKREPTAYSYNGVVLPKLPEWDREKYPYAVIGYCNTHGYVFSRSSNPWTANEYGNIFPTRFSTYYASDDKWATTNGALEFITPIWTNTDILNEDGSVYLAASDPIPVYE